MEHGDPLADADVLGHVAMVIGRDDGDVLAGIFIQIGQRVMRLFQGEFAPKNAEGVEGDGAVIKHHSLYTHFLVKAEIARRGHHLLRPHVMSPFAEEVLQTTAIVIGNSAFNRLAELVLGQCR